MAFQNAHKGIKLIFIAAILSIAAALLSLSTIAFSSVASIEGLDEGIRSSFGVISGVIGIVMIFALIACFVLELVGVIIAKRDSVGFGLALFTILGGIVASILAASLSNLHILANVFQFIANLCSVLTFYFIIMGVVTIAHVIGNQDVEERGRRLVIIFLIIQLISIGADFLVFILGINAVSTTIILILGIIALILEVLTLIQYLLFLRKGQKMLEN